MPATLPVEELIGRPRGGTQAPIDASQWWHHSSEYRLQSMSIKHPDTTTKMHT